MIFTEKRLGRHQKRENPSNKENLRTRQYAQLAEMNRQRLKGYAESFRELASSFREDFTQEKSESSRDRQSILEERKQWENQQLISNNLKEVASIMNQVADKELHYETIDPKKQKMLIHAMRSEGVYAETICYLPNEGAGKAIGMILSTEKKGGIPAEEVADLLSVLLKNKLEVSVTSPYIIDKVKRSFLFQEEAKFLALTGMAKVVKEKETVSGDNFSILQSETGRKIIMLSDGTGSGRQANLDSGRVLDLMEKMLEAGFETSAAVSMVNTVMVAKSVERNHPTLDICSINLYEGDCEICKIGGATTFLKRGKYVEIISRGTLPLGIFQNIHVQTLQRQVRDGDYLVFMTDGVLDALEEDSEEIMAETIRNIAEQNPQEMAEKLLQLVLKSCGGHILDDMTILVVGIWEN